VEHIPDTAARIVSMEDLRREVHRLRIENAQLRARADRVPTDAHEKLMELRRRLALTVYELDSVVQQATVVGHDLRMLLES
jgi:hypothetical protein